MNASAVGAGGTRWMARAVCADPRYARLPWVTDQVAADDLAAMQVVCAACPVAAACALFGRQQTAGVWAGASRTAALHRPSSPSLASARAPRAGYRSARPRFGRLGCSDNYTELCLF